MNKSFFFLFALGGYWALGGDEVSLLLLKYKPHEAEGQQSGQVWLPLQRIGHSRADVLAALNDRDIEILPEAMAELKSMPEYFWQV